MSNEFHTALVSLKSARRTLIKLAEARIPPLKKKEFKAAVNLVMEAAELLNLFPHSLRDENGEELEEIAPDRETVAEEIELSCDQALDVHGEAA